ncbi:hypothetical protein RIF29_38563 [Crotalaria pallida]|uniref:Uncharacterized protein n=1 Tax=Crotalaria pallida TaxID=3830 RepID=A0AAN9HPU2_CROPI
MPYGVCGVNLPLPSASTSVAADPSIVVPSCNPSSSTMVPLTQISSPNAFSTLRELMAKTRSVDEAGDSPSRDNESALDQSLSTLKNICCRPFDQLLADSSIAELLSSTVNSLLHQPVPDDVEPKLTNLQRFNADWSSKVDQKLQQVKANETRIQELKGELARSEREQTELGQFIDEAKTTRKELSDKVTALVALYQQVAETLSANLPGYKAGLRRRDAFAREWRSFGNLFG